jgi:hypothetical protein
MCMSCLLQKNERSTEFFFLLLFSLDIARHFIHRWNFSIISKDSSTLPLIPTCPAPWEYQDALRSIDDLDVVAEYKDDEVETSVFNNHFFGFPLTSFRGRGVRGDNLRHHSAIQNNIAFLLPSVLRCPRIPTWETMPSYLFEINDKERPITGNAKEEEEEEEEELTVDVPIQGIKLASKTQDVPAPRLSSLSELVDGIIDNDDGVTQEVEGKGSNTEKDTSSTTKELKQEVVEEDVHYDEMDTPIDIYDMMNVSMIDEDHPAIKPKMINSKTRINKIMEHDSNLHRISTSQQLYKQVGSSNITTNTSAATTNTSLKKKMGEHTYNEKYREIYRENVMYHGIKLMNPSFTASANNKDDNDDSNFNVVSNLPPCISVECQIVRSLAEWSGGVHENSIHTSYRRLIRRSKKYILIENQFFISGMEGNQRIKNRIIEEIYTRIVRAHTEQPHQFKVYIFMPLLPSEDKIIEESPVIRACMHWQFQTISRGPNSLFSMLRKNNIDPNDYIGVFSLRKLNKNI